MHTGKNDRHDGWWLLLIVVLGVGMRLIHLGAENFGIDSDEAIVGLMAKHIIELGAVPTFYYGQNYMGTLEPLTAAALFRVFGISNWALHLAPLLWFFFTQIIFYRLCRETMNQSAARFAGLLLAVAPVGFIEWSAKARGGFIEVIFLSVFALLFLFRSVRGTRFAAVQGNLVIGSFILGVGWWTNNQIVYVFPASALVFIIAAAPFGVKPFFSSAFWCLAVFLIGGSPYWIFNIIHPGASFGMFHLSDWSTIMVHAGGVWSDSIPILMGAKAFYQNEDIFTGATGITHFLFVTTLIVSTFILLRSTTAHVTQLFFFTCALSLICMIVVFSVSNFGFLFTAPRYLLPFYIFFLPLLSFSLSRFSNPKLTWTVFGVFIAMPLLSNYWNGEVHISGQPIIYNQERVSKDHSELIVWLKKEQISLVRTNYWIGYRLAFETNEAVKFILFQNPREGRIKSYEDLARSQRQLFETPLVVVESQAQYIREALSALGVPPPLFRETRLSGYVVFDKLSFPWLDELHPVTNGMFQIETSLHPEEIPFMLDGDEATRWASHAPQKAGMNITVHLKQPQPIRYVDLDIGAFRNDYPRNLFIEGATDENGTVFEPLYTERQSKSIQYFVDSLNESGEFLPAKMYTGLRLNQTGADRMFDWSIAELRLYEKRIADSQ